MKEPHQSPGGKRRGLPKLPPGRHGLSRDFVTQNQRDRLAAGIIASVARFGYHDATISRISSAAGVSRRTFYGYFSSKEECFADTYAMIVDFLIEEMETAGAATVWPEHIHRELAALLESLAANPDLVDYLLVAPPAAGGEIVSLHHVFLERLLGLLTGDIPASAALREPSQAAEYGIVGGLAALLVDKVRAGEGERLPELRADLIELTLTPYLGREEAFRVASHEL